MSKKLTYTSVMGLVAGAIMFSTGCIGLPGPSLGPMGIPLPVSPSLQQAYEDQAWENERYTKIPIMGPTTQGAEVVALDPPSDDQIMRALEKADPVGGGVPFLESRIRNNVRIVKEKIADYVDPPREYPLIGAAQLHHAHYKCTIYYTKIVQVGWPWPHTITNEDAQEVVYIDHDHFHMVGNVDAGNSPRIQ